MFGLDLVMLVCDGDLFGYYLVIYLYGVKIFGYCKVIFGERNDMQK